ncbi:MAG: hypothetical protein CMH64_04660 [Nanoarchaeota archaeon]|nr:hypothetical protein [Nanoarchaeota archaeon]|tara:strand:- start:109 stop:318 length:210 start_codon:yes stop_codon:yes gene_type:complete
MVEISDVVTQLSEQYQSLEPIISAKYDTIKSTISNNPKKAFSVLFISGSSLLAYYAEELFDYAMDKLST